MLDMHTILALASVMLLVLAALCYMHISYAEDEEQLPAARRDTAIRQTCGVALLSLALVINALIILDRSLPPVEYTEDVTYLDFPLEVYRYETPILKARFDYAKDAQAVPYLAWALAVIAAGTLCSRIGWRQRTMRRHQKNIEETRTLNEVARQTRREQQQREQDFFAYRQQLIDRYGPYSLNIAFAFKTYERALLAFPEHNLLLIARRPVPYTDIRSYTVTDRTRPSRLDPDIIRHDYTVCLTLASGEQLSYHIGKRQSDLDALTALLNTLISHPDTLTH
ncbi:MAG: hypothetical protein IJ609_05190 [Paludibacteraceae bacterium]|nr:hypothetical protein [Paludibacteraceae bacterium]